MHCNHRGTHSIQQTLTNFVASGINNGRVGHQMAYVTNQHQSTTLQGTHLARTLVGAIFVKHAFKGSFALSYALAQVTTHEPKPISISQYFVWRINRCNRILTIHNY